MSHNITAILLKGAYHTEKAAVFGLQGRALDFDLTLFHINHFQTACWQYELQTKGYLPLSFEEPSLLPDHAAIAQVVRQITGHEEPLYAVIHTDYFGGYGHQFACIYRGADNIDTTAARINQVLVHLGVVRAGTLDEFDTIGLGDIRSQPDYLDDYGDLAEQYGV